MRRRPIAFATAALLLFLGALCVTPASRVISGPLPSRIDDQTFWRMIVDFSEPGGFFRSDNFVSNETSYQQVVPELQQRFARGGVYLGVGPDQNFTYIVALQPRIAFIVDVRRQNMLLHLMYKALAEESADRAEFLSNLFSRRRPDGVGPRSSLQALFDAYDTAAPDAALFQMNLQLLTDRLIKGHRFPLTDEDLRSLDYVYRAFFSSGPDIRYSFGRGFGGWRTFPSYADLQLESDGRGENHSYLAAEKNFQVLKDLEARNLIVPLVGDFSGTRALRSVGRYLKDHGATVSVFYTSNVEQYLFQGLGWQRFFANVQTLPVTDTSMFIRAYFNNTVLHFQGMAPAPPPPSLRSVTLLEPIGDLVVAFNDGQIRRYGDVIERSH